MANWKQITKTPSKEYEPRIIDSDKLVSLLAQCHFLKQAGEEISLQSETNDKWEVTAYILHRKVHGGTAIIRFEKI